MNNQNQKLRGVNLGGWLVLEKWMTPKLFDDINGNDEYSLCSELGEKSKSRLEKHWKTFITKKDFISIKKQGINTLRIPVGYWNFEDDQPFVSSIKYLDRSLKWAKETELQVIIDLHTAPGSQNGWDHSGRMGEIAWHKDSENITRTLQVLEKIGQQYGGHESVIGIELLNEPHWDIPINKLKDFYKSAYERLRNIIPDSVVIIINDGFRPHEIKTFFQKNNFTNVILDCHLYQCFSDEDIKLDMFGHIQKTAIEWKNLITELQKYVPVIIGEWSLHINPQSMEGLNDLQKNLAKKAYADTQLLVFEQSAGWFFWNYKVENDQMKSDWSFRDLVENKMIKL